ncbi:phage tail protein [Salinadaptatus halalkaliphilus]|uniref:Phage tail protein n=1 Tax=Salinadaptatus halalkaliphilus TaxID=2419781 RepID=A0A4S3TMK1_9EURY|nr:phage tail protein [Salinadaptatus halalkaliphilus]THE64850.1 phage tail protein [Salinadaptatus halalkaliphilus]
MTFSYTVTTSETDWQEWATRNVQLTDGGVALAETTAIRSRPVGESVSDVTVTSTGVRYVLTTDGDVYRYEGTSETRKLVVDGTSRREWTPRLITASDSRLFVVDETGSVTAFAPETRRETETFETATDVPTAITYERGTLHVLDESGSLVSIRGNERATNRSSVPIVDVATVPDGIVVLTSTADGHEVWRFHSDQDETHSDKLLSAGDIVAGRDQFTPTAILVARGSIVLAGHLEGQDEHALFEYEPATEHRSRLLTLENAGPIETLVGDVSDDGLWSMYAIDSDDRCLALTERVEYVQCPNRNAHTGFAVTRYDSGTDQLEWHRLVLDVARVPANTRARIRYYATDEPLVSLTAGGTRPAESADSPDDHAQFVPADARESLRSIGVTSGLELVRTGAETIATHHESASPETVREWQRTVFDSLVARAESTWAVADVDEYPDVLLDDATGRYLYVALELVGTPTESPLVDTVTAYCPRQSYLRYMPELYQEDDQSAAFLERFLSIFETSFVDIQSEIEGITRYVDPYGVPSDSLEWLEDWLAADEYREWPESARREYLARAPELYERRGTRAGLRELIELYLRHAVGERPDESGRSSGDTPTGHRLFFLGPADLEQATDGTAGGGYESLVPADGSVAVCCGPFDSPGDEAGVETIVETETPAHVDVTMHPMTDEFELGRAAFLGMNTRLGTESFSLGDAALGQDTYLSPSNER